MAKKQKTTDMKGAANIYHGREGQAPARTASLRYVVPGGKPQPAFPATKGPMYISPVVPPQQAAPQVVPQAMNMQMPANVPPMSIPKEFIEKQVQATAQSFFQNYGFSNMMTPQSAAKPDSKSASTSAAPKAASASPAKK